jgi:SAM-dependent methyltransferase
MTAASRPAPNGAEPRPANASQPAPAERRQILDEHLATLAALLDEATFRYLDGLGVTAGWRCWEAGAGAGTVPRWLAARVGAAGHVLATDIDISRLTAGRQAAFEIRRHDLAADPTPGRGFDLVHARLVLEHLPDPGAAVTMMAQALRPGGWLLAESADPMLQPLACPDEHGAAQVLANKVRRAVWVVDARRGHLQFGRTLLRLLRDASLTGATAEARIPLTGPDTARLQRTLVLRRRDQMLTVGLLTGGEIDQHLADIADGHLDLAAFPVVSASGRAP